MVRWVLLMPDGCLVQGSGPEAPDGMKLGTIAAEAVAAMFRHPKGSWLVVHGSADILWTSQSVAGTSYKERALGVAAPPGSRVWLLDDGTVGLARNIEALMEASGLIKSALKMVKV